jgi:hypothetical protein
VNYFEESYSFMSVSVCLSLLSLLGNGWVKTFARQRIHATIEELLDASFSVRSVSYQKRVFGSVYPLTLLGNNSVKIYPRRRRLVLGVVFCALRLLSKKSRLFFTELLVFFRVSV